MNLTYGSRGEEVKKLQRALYDRGFLEKAYITGSYGSKTREAVMEYQKMARLSSADGIAGTETLTSIHDSSNKLTYRRISPAPAPRICSLLISKSCGREHIQRSLLECFREYAADIPYIKVLEG